MDIIGTVCKKVLSQEQNRLTSKMFESDRKTQFQYILDPLQACKQWYFNLIFWIWERTIKFFENAWLMKVFKNMSQKSYDILMLYWKMNSKPLSLQFEKERSKVTGNMKQHYEKRHSPPQKKFHNQILKTFVLNIKEKLEQIWKCSS